MRIGLLSVIAVLPMLALAGPPGESILHVSAAAGYRVLLDGVEAGRTGEDGLVLRQLAPGAHRVEIWDAAVRRGAGAVSLVDGEVVTWRVGGDVAGVIEQAMPAVVGAAGGQAVLVVQTVPSDCEVEIAALGVNHQRKDHGRWRASELPAGEVEVLLRRGEQVLTAWVTLRDHAETVLFADFGTGKTRTRVEGGTSPAGRFALIEPTAYMAGNAAGQSFEQVREVAALSPFWLASKEVTVAEWRQVMGPSDPWCQDPDLHPDEPIAVPLAAAQQFAERYGAATGQPGLFRLPTEAEWEYAARRGLGQDEPTLSRVRCRENCIFGYSGAVDWERPMIRLYPAASLEADELGLYDMLGSRWEWCTASWQDGLLADQGVLRGGAYDEPMAACTPWGRHIRAVTRCGGFRLLATAKPVEDTK